MPGAPAQDLFEDVVLGGAGDLAGVEAVLLGHGLVHGHHDGGHGVDGEAGAHLVHVDAVEGDLEVAQGVDGHAHPAHLACGAGVVGVEPICVGRSKATFRAGLAVGDEELAALVGVLGMPKPAYWRVVHSRLR